MINGRLSVSEDYWENFKVEPNDLEYLTTQLIEKETPLTSSELAEILVPERIRQEIEAFEKQNVSDGTLYLPKDQYESGQTLIFPALNYQKGKVTGVREGNNPDLAAFQVLEVVFESGEERLFAAGFEDHILNKPAALDTDDPSINVQNVLATHGEKIEDKLGGVLNESSELVCIGNDWFPKALLIDVNIGHLNLAEALLDMQEGGPLPTKEFIEQIEMPPDVNEKLTEFSLNYALEKDVRFDEVGPAGEILWFLKRLEPQEVQEIPDYLQYRDVEYDLSKVEDLLNSFEGRIPDELEADELIDEDVDELAVSLIYPHWRCGTLPLIGPAKNIFPTAFHSPRVKFTFVDGNTNQKFPGWVVRLHQYVSGLHEWYEEIGAIPGSVIKLKRGKNPGEVVIHTDKRRPGREWIRTVLVGTDGGIVFAMLKQLVSTAYDERMAVVIPDIEALDEAWKLMTKKKPHLEKTVFMMMNELAKLNTQGHIHAQELYAAVNVIRRCPPGPILDILLDNDKVDHLGDLYFHFKESGREE